MYFFDTAYKTLSNQQDNVIFYKNQLAGK